jgi:hypothetical protein
MFIIHNWRNFLNNLFLNIGIIGYHSDKYIHKYIKPILYNVLLVSGLLSSYFLDNYREIGVTIIWSIYIIVLQLIFYGLRRKFIRHNDYLYNLLQNDDTRELHYIYKLRLNLVFYTFLFYSCYCFVYTFLYNVNNSEPRYLLRCIVGLTWFYYFIFAGAIFLYIQLVCIHRKEEIKEWLITYKNTAKSFYLNQNYNEFQLLKEFYLDYDKSYYNCKNFNSSWKLIIISAFTMISFRIPLGLLYVFYYQNLLEIPTLIFQVINWFLLVYAICSLNDENRHFEEFLYKYKIFHNREIIEELLMYNKYRTLGINLYGFVPNFYLFAQLLIIIFNIILPILLAIANALIFNK